MVRIVALMLCLPLAACSGGNQMLATSGGSQDFAAMSTVSAEYGEAEADTTIMVMSEGQARPFRVWAHKSKPALMVQTGDLGRVASAAFVRGLTYGLVQHDPPETPFREAATRFVAERHGPGCTVELIRRFTRDAYEYGYACSAPPLSPVKRRPRQS